VFQGIGKVAFDFYLLFQHHATKEYLYQNPDPHDLVATGTGWSFIRYFGSSTVILGLDTRAERDKYRIMSQQSYDTMFTRLRQIAPTVIHCVVMLAVPIVYPRLDAVEKALSGVQAAKRGVNGLFNLLDSAVTTVTPSGQATQSTHSAFDGVKKAFGKSGLMSGVVSTFGEVDLLGIYFFFLRELTKR
jgi:PhoD related phosphatase